MKHKVKSIRPRVNQGAIEYEKLPRKKKDVSNLSAGGYQFTQPIQSEIPVDNGTQLRFSENFLAASLYRNSLINNK